MLLALLLSLCPAMTYSLHTLNNSKEAPPAVSGWQRFVQEIALSLGFVFLMFWLVAMISHSAQDPAWTTSGSSAMPHNWGGRIGAAISDLGFLWLAIPSFGVFWRHSSDGYKRSPRVCAAKTAWSPMCISGV